MTRLYLMRVAFSMAILTMLTIMLTGSVAAGQRGPSQRPASPGESPSGSVAVTSDYTIGVDDALSIVFWKEPDMSADVVVRPDGKLSLPLINEVKAVGLTPEELRKTVGELARKFVADPTVSVVVRQANSRKVFITGNVARPGPYPLSGPTTVLQLIATAGGLLEFADPKSIKIMRVEGTNSVALSFNYHDVAKGRNLKQNIPLRPGDTVLVP
jgi:polysaccharide biosynthesis/export protein